MAFVRCVLVQWFDGSGEDIQIGAIMPSCLLLLNLKEYSPEDIQTTSAALKTDLNPIPFSPTYLVVLPTPFLVLWPTRQSASRFEAENLTSLQSTWRYPLV